MMVYKHLVRAALFTGAAPFALLVSPVAAQDRAGAAGASDDGAIGDIVVTANRQAQNLQKVSAAVQVVDGSKLRSQALANVEQIFSDMPSVQITGQPAGFNVDIRGQGADRPAASSQGSVAVEFDGVYNIQSYATTIGFFDTSRIEVLPGPQSTRYGPNAKGGVVNIISTDPVIGSWTGQGSLTVGNYGLVRGEIGQNVPITDTLAVRLSGAAINRNSYFTPATGNAIAQSGRIKVLFQPSDRLTARLEYEFDHIGGTGSGAEAGGVPFLASMVPYYAGESINNTGNPWRQGDYSSGCGSFPPDFSALNASNSGTCQPNQTHSNIQQHMVIGQLNYRLADWAAIDATQSYIKEQGTQYDCKPESFSYVGSTHDCYVEHPLDPFYSYSTEVRMHNAPGNKVLWNLGFYHWNYHIESWTTQFGGSAAAKSLAATSTNAVFADATVPVTGALRLIAGLRGSKDQRQYSSSQDAGNIYRATYGTHFDYRVGEEYDITPSSMQYFTISTGYQPGSVGEGLRNDGSTGFFQNPNETLTAFELGAKNRFFNNRLQVNGDVFWYIQKNYAFNNSYSDFTANSGTSAQFTCPYVPAGQQQTLNCESANTTANAHTLGFEAQIRFQATHNDIFSVNGTWLRAKFDKNQQSCNTLGLPAADAAQGGCWIGTNVPSATADTADFTRVNGMTEDHAPSFQGHASYTHTFRLPSGASFDVGGDVFHSSGFWLIDSWDTLYFYQPAYTQGNASISFKPAHGAWSVSGYIRNISNYAVKVSAVPATTISDPRTFGASFNLKW